MFISKPGASIRTHQLVAASIWSIVGLSLMVRGGAFLASAGKIWLLAPAIFIGLLKSRFMLDKSADKNLSRLDHMKDGACIGGVYSIKMWSLVAIMIFMGRALRSSGLPVEITGCLYTAIGCALLFSSRILWKRFKSSIHQDQ